MPGVLQLLALTLVLGSQGQLRLLTAASRLMLRHVLHLEKVFPFFISLLSFPVSSEERRLERPGQRRHGTPAEAPAD